MIECLFLQTKWLWVRIPLLSHKPRVYNCRKNNLKITLVSTKFANQATLLHVVLKSYFYKYKKFATVEPGKKLDVGINRLSSAKWGCMDIKFTLCNISNQSFLRYTFSGDLSTLKIHTSMVPPPRSQCNCVWQKPKSKSFWFLKLGFHGGITWYNVV